MPDVRVTVTYPSYQLAQLNQIVALKGYRSQGELLREILREYLKREEDDD